MARSCCKGKKSRNNYNEEGTVVALKKGPWTPEEDDMLLSYVHRFGEGSWRSLSAKAGLKRCGRSCRLRWHNYLRPDIKRGNFSLEEERTIIQLHALLGNRWSTIATHLPIRTDSEIKNHWNSHIKKRLAKKGIDPVTHKPKVDTSLLGSNLDHMTQWEAARLEAEARQVQQPKPYSFKKHLTHDQFHKRSPTARPHLCLDVLKVWQGTLRSNYLINGSGLQTSDPTWDFFKTVIPPIIPTTPILNYAENNSSLNQGVNTRCHDKSEIFMERFDEFIDPHDANYITGGLLILPPSFFEGCNISDFGNHYTIHDQME